MAPVAASAEDRIPAGEGAQVMTDTTMRHASHARRDTLGQLAVVALAGLVAGMIAALAVIGVASLTTTVEPVTCISQTWA